MKNPISPIMTLIGSNSKNDMNKNTGSSLTKDLVNPLQTEAPAIKNKDIKNQTIKCIIKKLFILIIPWRIVCVLLLVFSFSLFLKQ